jgi:hypothetical protein
VAKVLFERWFCRFSAPTVMVSDQGKEFCNELVNRLCALWDVDKRRTSPYHPQTNSSAESYNRSMRKYITVMLDKNPTMDWEDLLPSMMLSYNFHVHRATGDSRPLLPHIRARSETSVFRHRETKNVLRQQLRVGLVRDLKGRAQASKGELGGTERQVRGLLRQENKVQDVCARRTSDHIVSQPAARG